MFKNGVFGQQEKRKTREKVHACSERVNAEGWCDGNAPENER